MSRLFHARQKLQKALADCYVEQIGAVPTDGASADSVSPASSAPASSEDAPPSSSGAPS
jgi:hypothetical protein